MSFAEDLAAFARLAAERADGVARAAVSETGRRLIARSPVSTGHFRANWQLGVGAPPTGEIVTSGTRESPALAPEIPVMKPGGRRYFWVNNVAYAGDLETGKGGRRPMGLTALAEMEFPSIVARTVKS
jgi:hypothetical protein